MPSIWTQRRFGGPGVAGGADDGDAALAGASSFIAQSDDLSKGLSISVPGIDPSWGLLGRQRRSVFTEPTADLPGIQHGPTYLRIRFPEPVLGQGQVPADGERVLRVLAATPAAAAVAGNRARYTFNITTGVNSGRGLQVTFAGTEESVVGAAGNDWSMLLQQNLNEGVTVFVGSQVVRLRFTGTTTLGEIKAFFDDFDSFNISFTTAYLGSATGAEIVGAAFATGSSSFVGGTTTTAATPRSPVIELDDDGRHVNVYVLPTDTVAQIASAIALSLFNNADGGISAWGAHRAVVGATGDIINPASTINVGGTASFTGGVSVQPLSVTRDDIAKTITLLYNPPTDNLLIIQLAFDAAGIDTILIYGTLITARPEAPSFSRAFIGIGGGGAASATSDTRTTVESGYEFENIVGPIDIPNSISTEDWFDTLMARVLTEADDNTLIEFGLRGDSGVWIYKYHPTAEFRALGFNTTPDGNSASIANTVPWKSARGNDATLGSFSHATTYLGRNAANMFRVGGDHINLFNRLRVRLVKVVGEVLVGTIVSGGSTLSAVSFADAATPTADNIGLIQNIEGVEYVHDRRHHAGHGKTVGGTASPGTWITLSHDDFLGFFTHSRPPPDNEFTHGKFYYGRDYGSFLIHRVHGTGGFTGITGNFTYDPFADGEPWHEVTIAGEEVDLNFRGGVDHLSVAFAAANAVGEAFANRGENEIIYASEFMAETDGYSEYFRRVYLSPIAKNPVVEFWGQGKHQLIRPLL